MGVPEREERYIRLEKSFKEIKAEIFLELGIDTDI